MKEFSMHRFDKEFLELFLQNGLNVNIEDGGTYPIIPCINLFDEDNFQVLLAWVKNILINFSDIRSQK